MLFMSLTETPSVPEEALEGIKSMALHEHTHNHIWVTGITAALDGITQSGARETGWHNLIIFRFDLLKIKDKQQICQRAGDCHS